MEGPVIAALLSAQQQTMLAGMAYEQTDIVYRWCDIHRCRSRCSRGNECSFRRWRERDNHCRD